MNNVLRKRLILYLLFSISYSILYGQNKEAVTLSFCYEKALAAYPALSDKVYLKNASDLRVKNIETSYLPQLSVNGQATYQSDVTKISLPPQLGMNLSGPAKDQYKLTLDAQQMLFDGGITRGQKKLEQASSAADIQQIETDLLRIKELVNAQFFNILFLQENKKLLLNVLNILSDREKTLQSMVRNGVLLKSDENILKAERLKAEQQITEAEINLNLALRILSILTNEIFTENSVFFIPEIIITDSALSSRQEYKTFEFQEKRVDAASSLSKSTLMPKLYAFGQYGYGRPGLNMLNNEFNDFYIVGATLKWNFWDWNKTRNEKQIYSIQKQMIATKRDNFTKNLNMDIQNRLAIIHKMDEALKRDADIVALREGITKIAYSQLNNGVITSTDYVNELNAETQARINMEAHKVQLIQAKANYLLAMGK